MSRTVSEKTRQNIYCAARMQAAEKNKSFHVRYNAANALSVAEETLKSYENGVVVPAMEIVMDMAEIYGAPELLSQHCCLKCPIGQCTQHRLEIKPVERAALQLISNTNGLSNIRETIAEITADGVIEDREKPLLTEVLEYLSELQKSIGEFELWAKKNGFGR